MNRKLALFVACGIMVAVLIVLLPAGEAYVNCATFGGSCRCVDRNVFNDTYGPFTSQEISDLKCTGFQCNDNSYCFNLDTVFSDPAYSVDAVCKTCSCMNEMLFMANYGVRPVRCTPSRICGFAGGADLYCLRRESVCGDGICSEDEMRETCPVDCPLPGVCGDGTCNPEETWETCPADCDKPGPIPTLNAGVLTEYYISSSMFADEDVTSVDHYYDPNMDYYYENNMLTIWLYSSGTGTLNLTSITIAADGTGDDRNVKGVTVYAKRVGGSIVASRFQKIGNSTTGFLEDNGTLTIPLSKYTIDNDSVDLLRITYRMGYNLTNGTTYKFAISEIYTKPTSELAPADGLPIESAVKTIQYFSMVLNTTCGNGELEEGEVCEVNMTNVTNTCMSLLGNSLCSGNVSCTNYCTWDMSDCYCQCDDASKPSSGEWSECMGGRQSRTVYECDTSTGRWEYNSEARACVMLELPEDEGFGMRWLIVGGSIAALLGGAFAAWYFYLGPRGLFMGSLFDKWFGGAAAMAPAASAEDELKKYAEK